jgi:glycosyltransferase involved in cell wall biosynthesis
MDVHQFFPAPSYGGAISNQLLSLQRLLQGLGYGSEIFCEQEPVHFGGQARPVGQYASYSSADNVLLLHFALHYSAEVLSWLAQIPDRKVLVYHNITPKAYFAGINGVLYEAALAGRRQLDRLRALTVAGWGDSGFNSQELAERGWRRLGVLPIVFDSARYAARPDRKTLQRYQGGTNLLFVGRLVPNKCFEDLILIFYYFKRYVRPEARLLLVGSTSKMAPYLDYLQSLIARLDLSDVVFAGHVSTAELVAYYRCASVFVSMSEHEGFGVPLLESMHFEVPVVAYQAAAVPETLGGCGFQVTAKDHRAVAELIGLLLEDEALRRRIVARQRARPPAFYPDQVAPRLSTLLQDLDR